MGSNWFLVSSFVAFWLTLTAFPSQQYDDDYQDVIRTPCRKRYCQNISSSYDFDNGCSCDESCWRHQMCCFNFLHQTHVYDSTYHNGVPKAVTDRRHLRQCQLIDIHSTDGYSVISKCEASHPFVDDTWKWQMSLCEKPVQRGNADDHLLMIPVSNYNTGETYKNIYCAACHHDLENITMWNTSISCLVRSYVSNFNEARQNLYVVGDDVLSRCVLRISPPQAIKTIRCTANDTRTCPQSFIDVSTSSEDLNKRREIEWLCQVTVGQVKVNTTQYENPYCAACHLNELDIGAVLTSKHGVCSNIRAKETIVYSYPITYDFVNSFPILLDLHYSLDKGNKVGMTRKCPFGYIYDGLTDKCRLFMCQNGFILKNGNCQVKPPIPITVSDDISFSIHSPLEELKENETAVSLLNCSKMQLERSEVVLNDNGTLTVHQQRLYVQGTFEIVDNVTVYVCVDFNDNYVFNFDSATHTYLTIICSSLSLTALLLKMIIFAVTSEIRKSPDNLVFCLSASLFIAQLLFLTTAMSLSTNYIACASVGVLTHYFFLSSFCWMNVLAYDIWNTLSQCIESRFIHSDSMKCRFHCYSLYAWVTPMLIVSAACVFEWSGVVDEVSIMRPHYGVNLCWINTRTGLLFYFAIPMALLLLTNFAFFVLAAFSICRSSLASSMVQSTAHSHTNQLKRSQSLHHLRFSIYVKLAVIMGFTWISGFVAAFSGRQWLWYVFTLSSASQGVYILIALTPRRNAVQILQRPFPLRRNKNSRSNASSQNTGNEVTHSQIMSNPESITT